MGGGLRLTYVTTLSQIYTLTFTSDGQGASSESYVLQFKRFPMMIFSAGFVYVG